MNTAADRRQRLLAVTMIALSAGLLFAVLSIYFNRGFIPGDAIVYLAAGERLNADHLLYQLSPGDRPLDVKPPFWTAPLLSPPLVAVLFRPLALLPPDAGAYVWWVASMAAIAWVLIQFWRRRPILTSLAVLVLVVPLTYEIGVGNMNAFLILGTVLIWRWSTDGREHRAGAVAAFITLMKVSPIVICWWLFTQQNWRAVAGGVAAGVVLIVISLIGAGVDSHVAFLELGRGTMMAGQSEGSLAGLAKFIGIPAGPANLLPTAVLVSGLIGVVLLRSRPGAAFSVAVATMVLGSPVVNINSYAMLLGCLAPLIWPREPLRAPSGAQTVPETPKLVPS